MADYLYYKRAEEWVRVNADAYKRQTGAAKPGACSNVRYNCSWRHNYLYTGGRFDGLYGFRLYETNGIPGPIIGPYEADEGGRARCELVYDNGTRSYGYSNENNDFHHTTSIVNVVIVRAPGEENIVCDVNEQGGCETKFTLNGSVVLTLDSCPEIANGRGCSDCCGELVAIAKKIQV